MTAHHSGCELLSITGDEFKPWVTATNNWLGLFPGRTLGLVVVAVTITQEMRPHKAGAGEEEKIISEEHSMLLILLQGAYTASGA